MRTLLSGLLPHTDMDYTSFFLATLTMCWGVQLWLPWETMTLSETWRVFRAISPHEAVWGAIFVGLGLAQHLARVGHRTGPRLVVTAIVCAVWFGVGVAFIVGAASSTGTVIYPFLLLAYLRLFFRIWWAGKRAEALPHADP